MTQKIKDDELVLWDTYHANRSIENRNTLVEYHRYVAVNIAKRIWKRLPQEAKILSDLDDLINEGIFGLIEAVKGFKLDQDVKFASYAYPFVWGRIYDSMRELDVMTRKRRQDHIQLAKRAGELVQEAGHYVTLDEIAEETGIENVDEILNSFVHISIDKLAPEPNNLVDWKPATLGEALHDPHIPDPNEMDRVHSNLRYLLRGLSQRERLLIISYFYVGETLKEVGKSFDCSESRMSQQLTDILKRLKAQKDLDRIAA